jgi:transcriptional regulator of acetoin/glycerol metabolism
LAKIRPLWEIEKQAILEVLEICKGDVIEAARCLEVGQATIYKKLKKWNVDVKKYRYQS